MKTRSRNMLDREKNLIHTQLEFRRKEKNTEKQYRRINA